MGFKDKVIAHRDALSKVVMSEALSSAAAKAQHTLTLQSNIDKIDPLLQLILQKYVDDATDLGYSAHKYFHIDAWRRCWWGYSFVPTPNEQPERGVIAGARNEATALVRLSNDGRCTLEWHVPGEDYSGYFLREELHRDLILEDVTPALIGAWLDEFTVRMLSHREKRDEATR